MLWDLRLKSCPCLSNARPKGHSCQYLWHDCHLAHAGNRSDAMNLRDLHKDTSNLVQIVFHAKV